MGRVNRASAAERGKEGQREGEGKGRNLQLLDGGPMMMMRTRERGVPFAPKQMVKALAKGIIPIA